MVGGSPSHTVKWTDVNKSKLDFPNCKKNSEKFKSKDLDGCKIPSSADKLSAGVVLFLHRCT